MSDVALRELERRWRRSGAPADGARYLRACRRAGALPLTRLRLAAALGDPAARAAVDLDSPPLPTADALAPLAAWLSAAVDGLEPAGRRRVGLAVVRPALDEWARWGERLAPRWRLPGSRGRGRVDPRPAELVTALERAVARPTDPAALQALTRARDAAAEVVLLRFTHARARAALDAVRGLLLAADAEPVAALRTVHDRLHPAPAQRIAAALRREVVPWALARIQHAVQPTKRRNTE